MKKLICLLLTFFFLFSFSVTLSAPKASTEKASPAASVKKNAGQGENSVFKENGNQSIQFGLRGVLFNFVNQDSLPRGFGITNTSSFKQELYVQCNFSQKISLEVPVILGKTHQELKFYGASMRKIHISTPIAVLMKFYPLGFLKFPYIGAGVMLVHVNGSFAMGGYEFPNTGSGKWPIFQTGMEFPLDKNNSWLVSVDYRKTQVKISSYVPGVGDLESTYTGSLAIGLNVRM